MVLSVLGLLLLLLEVERLVVATLLGCSEGVATEIVASFMGIDSARAEMLDLSDKAEEQRKALEEAKSTAEHANAAKSMAADEQCNPPSETN